LQILALPGMGSQPGHGGGIGVKQGRVRVITREQPNHQLVDVIAGQQSIARWHDVPAHPFRAFEGTDFRITRIDQMQGLQRQQHGPKVRAGPLGPFSHQRCAAMMAREHFQNQAAFAPVVTVQHIGWLVGDALHVLANRKNTGTL